MSSIILYGQHKQQNTGKSIPARLEQNLDKALDTYRFDDALKIADSMTVFGIKSNDSILLGYSYEIKSEIYKYRSNYKSALYNIRKSTEIFEKLKDSNRVVASYNALAWMIRSNGYLDSSNYYLSRAKKFINDSTKTSVFRAYYNQKSISLANSGRLDSAIYYTIKGLELFEPTNYYGLSTANIMLSTLFYRVYDYDKALDYINSALTYADKSEKPLKLTKFRALAAKCEILYVLNRRREAEEVIEIASPLIAEGRYSNYETDMRIMASKLKFEQALNPSIENVLHDSLIIDKKLSNQILFKFYLTQLDQLHFIKEKVKSRKVIDRLYNLLPNLSNINLEEAFYKTAVNYWNTHLDQDKKNKAEIAYLKLKDKINDRQKTYIVYDLEKRYQTEQKERELIESKLKIANQKVDLEKKTSQYTLMTALAVIAFSVAFLIWYITRQRQKQKDQELMALKSKQQVLALESLIEGEEKERSRIAKDLHDGVNGDLSAIKHALSKYQDKKGIDLSEPIEMIDQSCDQVRAISHNLLPPTLEAYTLKESLKDYCYNLNEHHNAEISFQYVGQEFHFSKSARVNIFRIVQELLNNSLKHSNAKEMLVQITSFNETIQLTVEDNGIGFDMAKIKGAGLGIENVTSRVNYFNGELDVQSDNNGTHFNIMFYKYNLDDD